MSGSTCQAMAFTASIEAAEGVGTGISAADRALTIQTAIKGVAQDIVQPGHVFPVQAADGGVLARAGYAEAACDLVRMAGCAPSAAFCAILDEDGSMMRQPQLRQFAIAHGLKICDLANLIEYRLHNENLVHKVSSRLLQTAYGEFIAHAYQDMHQDRLHLALVKGEWLSNEIIPLRLHHEPLSALDHIDTNCLRYRGDLTESLYHIQQQQCGVVFLLDCGESTSQLLARFDNYARADSSPPDDLDARSYRVVIQILRECGAPCSDGALHQLTPQSDLQE